MELLQTLYKTFYTKGKLCYEKISHFCLKTPKRRTTVALIAAAALLGLSVLVLLTPPVRFPGNQIIRIEEGMTLEEAARELDAEGVVRSPTLLKLFVRVVSSQHSVIAGDYFFEEPQGTIAVARRITTGDYGLTPVRVWVPEGVSIVDIAGILADSFNTFDTQTFLELANGMEGYLFPDTYFFLPNVDAKEVIARMHDNFTDKIEPLKWKIRASRRSLEDIITMASIIEKEASDPEARRLISGVLWNRIEIGMPLQVDVTFDYINGKNTFDLTEEDLNIDSPYNTYVYPGLPPGPIGNPSIDAIEAALEPTASDYLYFLADLNGEVHYSVTFEEHVAKKRRYLQ